MANIKLNPVFEAFSKKVGDLVFYTRSGKTFARRKGERKDPATSEQLEIRSTFSELASDWSTINGPMHRCWNQWALKKKKRGHNAYIGENFSRQRNGEPVELFKPMGNLSIQNFSASPGASGEITCSFTPGQSEGSPRIYFFTKERIEGMSTGEIRMHDGGKTPQSPFTITGLAPGAEYAVYAVLTDGKYDEAVQVSASLSSVCASGA